LANLRNGEDPRGERHRQTAQKASWIRCLSFPKKTSSISRPALSSNDLAKLATKVAIAERNFGRKRR
jgi:hypothetical protein